MKTPDFYDLAPRITLRDPLADLLGACDGGLIDYGYADAVKLAGHSCPTVAGAYLMTVRGLSRLYPGEPAERGGVKVLLRATQDEGTAGVTAAVVGLLTGAAGSGGFKGLGGRFARRNLLEFGAAIPGDLRLVRLDTGHAVDLAYHPEIVPASDALRATMSRAVQPDADTATRAAFGDAWQARVRAILVEHALDPRLVTVQS